MEVQTIIFEGFGDQEPGWDFDMPIYMCKPVKHMGEYGSITCAEFLIENYLILMALNEQLKDDQYGNWKSIMNEFYRARKGKAGSNIIYWKQEVTIYGDITNRDFNFVRDIKSTPVEYFIKGKEI